MMTNREALVAFLALVVAIVALSITGSFTSKPTDLAIMTGLIGILGTFKPRVPGNTSNVEKAETVNQTGDVK